MAEPAIAANMHAEIIPTERQVRDLSKAELKIRDWIKVNTGVLSRVARETGKSVAFVQRVAYNREARSKGLVVERKLLELGCPLIQKLR